MPFTKRGWLLARMAALLMLGSAAAGCQTSPICRACMFNPSSEEPIAPVAAPAADEGVVPASATAAGDGVVPASATEQAAPPVNTSQAYAPAPAPVPQSTPLSPPAQPPAGQPGCQTCPPYPTPQYRRGGWLSSLFRSPTTQEPPRLVPTPTAQGAACTGPGCSSAVMLRPVPADGGFTTAQHVPAPEAPAATYNPVTRPSDLPPVSSAAPPPEPLPPPKTEKNNGKEPKKDQSRLAMPREFKREGLPDLPMPTVTNPPAAPREFAKRALSDYVIEPPDVLQIDLGPGVGDPKFPIRGTHLVRPDGTIGLGPHGSIFVAGLTMDQAKQRIADRLVRALFEEKQYHEKFNQVMQGLRVDVAAYNSKFYYIIADGGGYGEQVYRVLCTGNETILDAVAQVEGLPRVASKKKIWIARATPTEVHSPQVLPVDWVAVTQLGAAATNYQIYPGDRIYINSDPLIRADSALAKIISPIERLFGITLLGSTTVNSIRNRGGTGSGIR